ncbi:MAG: WecB/TagA/CpsF family glycosyltransferase, partial [Firmicutes bacterium]|nr:WecB/TagA/CpsF family glycosyltransferase [Bacillota bacterium]
VALGSPKQELFMEKYKGRFKNVRAAVGVGGSLDVWSGTLDRAPKFYRDHGLEWLYRLIQQPSRIGRMAEIPRFLIKVLITRRKNANRT